MCVRRHLCINVQISLVADTWITFNQAWKEDKLSKSTIWHASSALQNVAHLQYDGLHKYAFGYQVRAKAAFSRDCYSDGRYQSTTVVPQYHQYRGATGRYLPTNGHFSEDLRVGIMRDQIPDFRDRNPNVIIPCGMHA